MDHVSSLPALLEAFPKAQVAMHILEAPYAVGGVSYAAVPADNWAYTIMHRLAPDTHLHLPVHRLLFLSGMSFCHVICSCISIRLQSSTDEGAVHSVP